MPVPSGASKGGATGATKSQETGKRSKAPLLALLLLLLLAAGGAAYFLLGSSEPEVAAVIAPVAAPLPPPPPEPVVVEPEPIVVPVVEEPVVEPVVEPVAAIEEPPLPPGPVEPPPPPAPSAPFMRFAEAMTITGVFQGSQARAFVNGRIVRSGEEIESTLGIKLMGVDAVTKHLILEERSGAQLRVKY
jgi:hypothetical protein